MKNNTLPKATLSKDDVLRIEKMKDGKHNVYIFKCSNSPCSNEIRVTQLGRATGYCTSCLSKGRPFGVIYSRVLSNAKIKGLPCDLSYGDFIDFTKTKICVYCRHSVTWTEHIDRKNHASSYNLDRKDPNQGYTKENLVVCCKTCNWAKNDLFSHEEFLVVGEAIGRVKTERGLRELVRLTEEYGGYDNEFGVIK